MVGCDDVNPARAKGFYQRVSILSTFNGRVAFDEITKPRVIIIGEPEMVYTSLSRYFCRQSAQVKRDPVLLRL